MALDRQGSGTSNFDATLKDIFVECADSVSEDDSADLPSLQAKFLNTREYDDLSLRLGTVRGSDYGLRWDGIVAFDIQHLLKGTPNFASFVVNLIITYFEELLHTASPLKGEEGIKRMAYSATEQYLGIPIPKDYKEASYKFAKDPNYGA